MNKGEFTMSMKEQWLQVFFPKTCPLCKRVLTGHKKICRDCSRNLPWIREPKCRKCGKSLLGEELLYCSDCNENPHFFERGISVFEYQNDNRESLQRFKYQNAREYADFYGFAAAYQYHNILKDWKIEAIIPVPVHRSKERQRGYNQAQVFANALSGYIRIPVCSNLLVRIRKTAPQKEFTKEMRMQNLKNAFAVKTEHIGTLKTVLLVDDIYTTGSTADACSRVLKKAGIEKVYLLCISAGQNAV